MRYIDQDNPVAEYPLNRGLAAWWLALPQAAGASGWGSMYLRDLPGRYPGLLTNGPQWAGGGRPGGRGSLSLDGVDDKLAVVSPPVTVMPLSVTCWFRTTSAATNQCLVYLGDGSASFSWCALVVRSTGKLSAYYDSTSDENRFADSAAGVTAGVWQFGAAVFGGTASRQCYLDAVAGTEETTASNGVTINRCTFGMLDRASPLWAFGGLLDDVRVYSRALSAAEVAALYDQSRRGHPDTLRWLTPRAWFLPAPAAPAGAAAPSLVFPGSGGGLPGITFGGGW